MMWRWVVLALACSSTSTSTPTRAQLTTALAEQGVTAPPRTLVHVSHTCDLQIEGATYFVVDVREVIPGMNAPRGVNQIVVLDSALRKTIVLRYVTERPLSCWGSQLLVFGTLTVESADETSSGNVLTFSQRSERVSVCCREGPQPQFSPPFR